MADRPLNKFRRGWRIALVGGLAAIAGLAGYTVRNFQLEDELWAQRQRTELIDTLAQIHPSEKFRDIQEKLYDNALLPQCPEEIISEIQSCFGISRGHAEKFALTHGELYAFIQKNLSRGVTFEKINNQFRDKIQGLTKKFAAEYQAIDLSDSSTKKSQLENNLLDALIKYSIEGYKNRWM